MSAIDCLINILNTNLASLNLQYCFVNEKKLPFTKDGNVAHVNEAKDFCSITELNNENLEKFNGVGISINFSNVIAIDVDKCFTIPFDITSGDDRAKDIIELFKDYYVEFSFSGKGLRVILQNDNKKYDFENNFYIKNQKKQIEIYYPHFKSRYVTLTGRYIHNNEVKVPNGVIDIFLAKYMVRDKVEKTELADEHITIDDAKRKLKKLFITNSRFLDVWSGKAPGYGRGESEKDYYIMMCLCESVTTNVEIIKKLIEQSDYFKSKDSKHLHKWQNTNYFYNTINKILKRRA